MQDCIAPQSVSTVHTHHAVHSARRGYGAGQCGPTDWSLVSALHHRVDSRSWNSTASEHFTILLVVLCCDTESGKWITGTHCSYSHVHSEGGSQFQRCPSSDCGHDLQHYSDW